MGLSESQREKLFAAFAQADASTTRKYGGTGLGLSICKHLVELMQGEIFVNSEPGVGSTFSFTAQFGLQQAQRPLLAPDPDLSKLRILVVDDNARVGKAIQSMLSAQHFNTHLVGSGEQALSALQTAHDAGQAFGLVLVDWLMPDLDGLATIRKIRQNPALDNLPIFSMAAGMNDHIGKPININQLFTVLARWITPQARCRQSQPSPGYGQWR